MCTKTPWEDAQVLPLSSSKDIKKIIFDIY